MAQYLTQDLVLNLGDNRPEDTTLNMLQFQERKTTLVIARSALPEQQTLDDAYTLQLELLSKQLNGFTCTAPKHVLIGQDPKAEGLEAALQFMHGDQPTFQLQLACQLPGQQRLLVLNYSKHSLLTDADIEHWRWIKNNLRFA